MDDSFNVTYAQVSEKKTGSLHGNMVNNGQNSSRTYLQCVPANGHDWIQDPARYQWAHYPHQPGNTSLKCENYVKPFHPSDAEWEQDGSRTQPCEILGDWVMSLKNLTL